MKIIMQMMMIMLMMMMMMLLIDDDEDENLFARAHSGSLAVSQRQGTRETPGNIWGCGPDYGHDDIRDNVYIMYENMI